MAAGKKLPLTNNVVLDQAAADKDEGLRIMSRSGGGLRPYCRQSLRDLLNKAEEIGPVASQ